MAVLWTLLTPALTLVLEALPASCACGTPTRLLNKCGILGCFTAGYPGRDYSTRGHGAHTKTDKKLLLDSQSEKLPKLIQQALLQALTHLCDKLSSQIKMTPFYRHSWV